MPMTTSTPWGGGADPRCFRHQPALALAGLRAAGGRLAVAAGTVEAGAFLGIFNEASWIGIRWGSSPACALLVATGASRSASVTPSSTSKNPFMALYNASLSRQ